MRYCCFMNFLQFHVSSVSTTISLTDIHRLNLLFPSAKCSGQPTAGAKQMFTSEQVRLESVYSKLLKEFSKTIWSMLSDFCQTFHSNVRGLIIVVLLKFNTKENVLKSRFLSLPLKALHSLAPNHFKPHLPLLQSTIFTFQPNCSAHPSPNTPCTSSIQRPCSSFSRLKCHSSSQLSPKAQSFQGPVKIPLSPKETFPLVRNNVSSPLQCLSHRISIILAYSTDKCLAYFRITNVSMKC